MSFILVYNVINFQILMPMLYYIFICHSKNRLLCSFFSKSYNSVIVLISFFNIVIYRSIFYYFIFFIYPLLYFIFLMITTILHFYFTIKKLPDYLVFSQIVRQLFHTIRFRHPQSCIPIHIGYNPHHKSGTSFHI